MNDNSIQYNTFQSNIPGFKIIEFLKVHRTEDVSVIVQFKNSCFKLNKKVTIPMRDVRSSVKFQKYIPQEFAIEGARPSQQVELLQYEINLALNKSDLNIKTALPQGFSSINGKLFYVIGKNIFPKSNVSTDFALQRFADGFVADNPHDVELNDSFSKSLISMEEIFSWCMTYCSQGTAQATLFLCSLTPYLKYALSTASVSGNIVNAYIVGPSGVGKTEQVKLLSAITKDQYGINLESDKSQMMEFFSKVSDRSLLVDDLNLTAAQNQKNKKETRLSELIQMSSCAGEIYVGDTSVNLNNIALMVSAEYLLPNPSTINRCVVLSVEETFDSEILTQLQKEQYLYVDFVKNFVSWLCQLHRQLTHNVEEFCRRSVFHIAGVDKMENYIGFSRIYNSYKILQLTAYVVEEFFSRSLKIEKIHHVFQEGIEACIADTLNAVKASSEDSDILNAFLESFKEDDLISETANQYVKHDGRYIFLFSKGELYFKGQDLSKYLSEMLGRTISTKAISKALVDENLLIKYGNCLSECLPHRIRKKVKSTAHFYRVNVRVLMDILMSRNDMLVYIRCPIYRLLKESEAT